MRRRRAVWLCSGLEVEPVFRSQVFVESVQAGANVRCSGFFVLCIYIILAMWNQEKAAKWHSQTYEMLACSHLLGFLPIQSRALRCNALGQLTSLKSENVLIHGSPWTGSLVALVQSRIS